MAKKITFKHYTGKIKTPKIQTKKTKIIHKKPLSVDDEWLVQFMFNNQWMIYKDMVMVLSPFYCSKGKDPKELSESHLSNFSRKDLGLRRIAKGDKSGSGYVNWIVSSKGVPNMQPPAGYTIISE